MFWLILQILFFLLVSAGIGAALAWWWFHRRYEDITERYSVLMRNQSNMPSTVSKSDLDASLTAGLQSLNLPNLSPLEDRVAGLERSISSLSFPDPDLSPLQSRLEMIEAHLTGTNPEIDALSAGVGSISDRVERLRSDLSVIGRKDDSGVAQRVQELSSAITEKQWVDLRPLEARMARLEAVMQTTEPPELDLTSVHSAIADVQLQLEGLRPTEVDFAPIQGQLDHLVETLADLRQNQGASDAETLDAITGQLTAMSSALATMETPNLDPLRDRLAGIERMLSELALPDIGPVYEQLQGLHVRLANFEGAINAQGQVAQDLEPVQRQLEFLTTQIMAPDQNLDVVYGRLTSLTETIAGMEAALGALRNQVGTGQYGQGLDIVERRLAAMQESLMGLRQPDLAPVVGQIRAMDSRLDFSSMESRLTAIEYSLASLHQLMRARDVVDYAPPPQIPRQPPPAYVPQQPLETRGYYSTPITPPSSLGNATARPTIPPPPPPPDPIEAERRPDDRANLLVRPAFGTPDDLERISGVGPKLRDMLHGIGVYYFWQVAEWTPEQVEWVDSLLDAFHGRIERDNWVSQARMMAAEPTSVRRPGS